MTAEQDVQARSFKCVSCGAQLAFDAASGKLKCGHCGATADVVPDQGQGQGQGRGVEHDFFANPDGQPHGLGLGPGVTVRVHRCNECGAQVSFPERITATSCTFCGSPHVLEQDENQNALRPESLLPFAVDRRAANDAFGRWLRGLWFRPNDLRQLAHIEELAGVYVPFWSYDADVVTRWRAERGYHYYTEEEYTTQEDGQEVRKRRQVQHTRWEPAWGRRHDSYDDVLVCASRGLPADLASHLKHFDTQRLVPYAPGYLAGWRAEEYAVSLREGWTQARVHIERDEQLRCTRDVGGDTHRNLSFDCEYRRITFQHLLLPVWLAAYRYRGKIYRFLVNGQTGEVVGKAPWSVAKLSLFIGFIGLLVAVVIALALHFRN